MTRDLHVSFFNLFINVFFFSTFHFSVIQIYRYNELNLIFRDDYHGELKIPYSSQRLFSCRRYLGITAMIGNTVLDRGIYNWNKN